MVKMGTVWDRTAEFISDNLGALLPVTLFAIFVPFSITGNFAELGTGASPALSATLTVLSLLFMLLQLWGQLAITALALDPGLGRAATVPATRRLAQAVAVRIGLGLLYLLLAAPALVMLWSSGFDFNAAAEGRIEAFDPAIAGGITLYLLLALPVALVIFARLVLLLPIVMAQGGWFGAFLRSFQLTRGATLRILGVLVLYLLVMVVAVVAANSAFGLIFRLVAGGEDGGVTLASVLTSVVTAAVQTAFTVLATAFTAKLYVALIQPRVEQVARAV